MLMVRYVKTISICPFKNSSAFDYLMIADQINEPSPEVSDTLQEERGLPVTTLL